MQFNVYVISLKRATERRQAILDNLHSINLKPIIFDAVDGKNLSEQDQSRVFDGEQVVLNLKLGRKCTYLHKLSAGEIGCALSHLKVYQQIIDNRDDYALILEDDCQVTENIHWLIDKLPDYLDKWDVVNLSDDSGIRDRYFLPKYPIKNDTYIKRAGMGSQSLDALFNRRRLVWRSHAYFIKPKACQKFLDMTDKIMLPSDVLLGHIAYNGLKTFLCSSTNQFVQSFTKFASLIDQTSREGMKMF